MKEDDNDTQIPIFKFLNKHKWRIVLPLLFSLFYFALPRYLTEYIAVQQNLFYKSSVLSKAEIVKEFSDIKEQILSDDSLKNLIYEYDLYKSERENNVPEHLLTEKMKNSIQIGFETEANNQSAWIWTHFRKENGQNIVSLSAEIMSRFEKNPDIHIDKYVSEPYEASPTYGIYVFIGGLLQGFVLLVIPLILLWEIPQMFYSRKTKEMVFEPLLADWESELTDAKLRNQTLKAAQINVRYYIAFLSAMLQKSPLGDFYEFVSKMAR